MILLWILLAILYVAWRTFFGMTAYRTGHRWMLSIGFLLPILWIIGAPIGPTDRVAASGA